MKCLTKCLLIHHPLVAKGSTIDIKNRFNQGLTFASAAPAPKPDPERLAAIVNEMKSPDREVRLKAVGKLVHFEGGQELALPVLANLREAMRDPEADIRAAAQASGMVLMREDGQRLVDQGITSAQELVRITRD